LTLWGGIVVSETIIYKSNSFDPWYNLAAEDLLLDTVGEHQYILYLWQNRDTVVIGKNQNPWKECRVGSLEQDGGHLARRLSGGGAVFHDLGNLNFTFLMSRENYDLTKQTDVILTAIRKLGIPAELNGRNDLTAHGRKFSGNAFCFRQNSAFHHGTILVASNLEKLTKYLRVSEEKISSKGIESVRSRVINLNEYVSSLTTDKVIDAFCQTFIGVYGGDHRQVKSIDTLDRKNIEELYRKYASWEWRYGETLSFDLELSTRFEWGGVDIGLVLRNGIISEAKVYSDAMDVEFIEALSNIFIGGVFNAKAMAQSIWEMDTNEDNGFMREAIAGWLDQKAF
jgi:lipoate-protein ligase A